MNTLVTGATGLVGGNLAVALMEAGHSVRCTKRSTSRTAHLDAWGFDWHEATLGDQASLERAFQDTEVVFHCAAAVSIQKTAPDWVVDANVRGTERVIAACRAAGVDRLVHCSSTVAVGMNDDASPANEKNAWNFDVYGLADGYSTTKRDAELAVMAEVADGLDAVVVNPGYMFGPLDIRPSSGKLLLEVERRAVPGASGGSNCFVDVRDVAAGMILAAERGKTGERYILGGENLSYGEVFQRIAAVAGSKPITALVPRWLANFAGWFGDAQQALTGREPLVNSNTIAWGYEPRFRFSSDKARRELGYTTRPLEEGIQAALEWFSAHGMR